MVHPQATQTRVRSEIMARIMQLLTLLEQHHMLDVPLDRWLFLHFLAVLLVSLSNPAMHCGLAIFPQLRLSPI